MTRAAWLTRSAVARVVVLVVVLLTVAGCTGVPGSSGPQVVRTIGLGESAGPSAAAPPAGASPRSIVQGFLQAMSTDPSRLDAARAFLDSDAAQKWTGTTATIVQQNTFVVDSQADSDNSIKVTYQAVGTLSTEGIYRPATSENFGVGTTQTATYTVARNSGGQWRIQQLPNGLFIGADDFARLYTPKPLYFLPTSGTRLVPDLRYSALGEPSVETFLLTQLAAGPRPDLEGVVNQFAPAPTGTARFSVTPGSPTVVQIPGSAALGGDAVTQLAAQVAYTLRPPSFQSELQIQDGSRVISVPGLGSTFDAGDFQAYAPVDDTDSASLTYIRGGAVVDAEGSPVPGAYGNAQYDLDSAVFDRTAGRTLVAGTTGPDGSRRLLVGDPSGLKDVGLAAGPLTAPVWAPISTGADVDEVWVASGGQIYRYAPTGTAATKVPEPVPVAGQNALSGTIASLSFSPEGSRLALVIRSPDDASSQVWLASVLRNGPDVQIGQPQRVTPTGYEIADVGWRSDILLAAVGTSSDQPGGVYVEVGVDGARLRATSTEGLPDRPRALAVSPVVTTQQWVTVGSGADVSVWTRGSSLGPWTSPSGASQSGYGPSFSI